MLLAPLLAQRRRTAWTTTLAIVLCSAWALLPACAAVGAEPPRATDPDPVAMRRAIDDLVSTFGQRYPQGLEFRRRLETLQKQCDAVREKPAAEREAVRRQLAALRREALLANPLLDFDRVLLIRRGLKSPDLGLPGNSRSNAFLRRTGYDDAICTLSLRAPQAELQTIYRPEGARIVADLELHFDAGRLLFSMPDQRERWQVCELQIDGRGFHELTGQQPDVDSYDACYLPDGRIVFASTACYTGVPCVRGASHVANLYAMDADGGKIRQLTFDQDDDWCPSMLGNGRILYLRWEYTDTPHYTTRILFHMNPDGTEQMEYYGSNSYWPNGVYFARAIPGHPTKVVGVVSGHHGVARMGELVILDPRQGRFETDGVVQRIPGYGKKVEPVVADKLVDASWPKFLHPYPLSDKHFLVAMQPDAQSLWGIYLVDVFDNLVLLKEAPGYALFEPIAVHAAPRPPVIPPKANLDAKEALVYVADIYGGPGMQGVPRGTVQSVRVFAYHYAYRGVGGLVGVVGVDGPWDVKRILGTVPVHEDGSLRFRLPPYTPASIQPLDAQGKAVQLMRSWMTAMPGEVLACAGCHERQNTAPPVRATLALQREPSTIQPWRGAPRGFSYRREVQPVIDRYCVGCHNGQPRDDGRQPPDLRGTAMIDDFRIWTAQARGLDGKFTVGYANLHRYVRRPGIESDYHMLAPLEFHANTTELVQMLQKGHHGVQLDPEAWDRLITWIDLNCPFHGTWGEEIKDVRWEAQRRREMLRLYAGIDDDPEAAPPRSEQPIKPVAPAPAPPAAAAPPCPGWPFAAAEARRRQQAAGGPTRRVIELAAGVPLEMALIPAGEFVMGSADGPPDEQPATRVRIDRPFWMSVHETTNRQFAAFDPSHDSGFEDRNNYQFGVRGVPHNRPPQPVVRVSWQRAVDFCRWLSTRAGGGAQFALPTEAQWEYACRAGAAAPFWYGAYDADFGRFANLADAQLSQFALHPYSDTEPLKNPSKYDDWLPKDARFNDGGMTVVAPGRYQSNPWGLCDMHGNVAEWTRSLYKPYPYRDDARNDADRAGWRVARGGSWHDRPLRCTASFRLGYEPFQRVYNVGFRVVCDSRQEITSTASPSISPRVLSSFE